jgi:hypothetical protein
MRTVMVTMFVMMMVILVMMRVVMTLVMMRMVMTLVLELVLDLIDNLQLLLLGLLVVILDPEILSSDIRSADEAGKCPADAVGSASICGTLLPEDFNLNLLTLQATTQLVNECLVFVVSISRA